MTSSTPLSIRESFRGGSSFVTCSRVLRASTSRPSKRRTRHGSNRPVGSFAVELSTACPRGDSRSRKGLQIGCIVIRPKGDGEQSRTRHQTHARGYLNFIVSLRLAIAGLSRSVPTISLRRTNIAAELVPTGLSCPTRGVSSKKISTSPNTLIHSTIP